MGFTKLDSGIVNSSIWSEPPSTRVLWITILAMVDRDGFVSCSIPGLIRAANINSDEFEKGIKTLESPDGYSRTPDFDGRRIEKVEGGWMVLNFLKYREHSEIIKEQTKERVRKFREKQGKKSLVTQGNVTVTLPSASASASASASECINQEGGAGETKLTWRTSFEVYEKECTAAFKDALTDKDWLAGRERYHPTLDIRLSLEKSYEDFWSTEAGWEHKKKSKVKKIDWQRTIENALTLPSNQVRRRYENNAYAR
jgi:hypothetical protein